MQKKEAPFDASSKIFSDNLNPLDYFKILAVWQVFVFRE